MSRSRPGALRVFPRLVAAEHRQSFRGEVLTSGIDGLDALMGGGLAPWHQHPCHGTCRASASRCCALHYAVRVQPRGHKAVIYLFDEEVGLLLDRAHQDRHRSRCPYPGGRLILEQVDAAELSPGEFAHKVCARVERDDVRLVVIDSLNGYYAAMPEEKFLVLQLHELLAYLNRRGVVTILPMAQHGLIGEMQTPVDLTYLSDAVVLLRFFEAAGGCDRQSRRSRRERVRTRTPSASSGSPGIGLSSGHRSRTSMACFGECRPISASRPPLLSDVAAS